MALNYRCCESESHHRTGHHGECALLGSTRRQNCDIGPERASPGPVGSSVSQDARAALPFNPSLSGLAKSVDPSALSSGSPYGRFTLLVSSPRSRGESGLDIFVSHATADATAAGLAADALESLGLRCWMASRRVPVGGDYAEEIWHAIDGCGAILVIMSKDALASEHVKREVDIALTLHRPLLPVSLNDRGIGPEDLPANWRYRLAATQIATAETPTALASIVADRLGVRDSSPSHSDGAADPETKREVETVEVSTAAKPLVASRLEAQVRSALIQAAAVSSAFEVAVARARRIGASEAETRAIANALREARLLTFDGELTPKTTIRLT